MRTNLFHNPLTGETLVLSDIEAASAAGPVVLTQELAVEDAEDRIQGILMELETRTGKRVDQVETDTRNFAQLRTKIWLRPSV